IFASIGEELGFVGILIMLALFATLLYRTIRVAHLSQDKFGRFVAVGIFGLYFYHFLQNAAMNIGLLPVTGIPMSFVSYGGSHTLIAFASLGLLQSILLRYKKIKY
ncbi:MAG: FtsW/RodA/SpoVE family cell cycle protein, partial [Candidatus Gracilibacteria bacterium]|nr:FtsW/RodA/SpoVE family cell cycle protein [Candidatus Gracilibacteria bacterium]